MKIVLVPGMDGTGTLFGELITYLEGMDHQVIPLPDYGNQSYEVLTGYIMDRLPSNEGFILLVESFSGPIGLLIAKARPANLKKIIVVASFTQALLLTKMPLSATAVNYARS